MMLDAIFFLVDVLGGHDDELERLSGERQRRAELRI